VEVSSAAKPRYGIISVTYKLVREPATGCPTNVRYKVYATITTNGPYEFDYYWDQKDGNESGVKNMVFKEAGSQTVMREWMVGKGDNPEPRWMQIIVVSPDSQDYERIIFEIIVRDRIQAPINNNLLPSLYVEFLVSFADWELSTHSKRL
jgi:hypothetical protein